MKSLKQFLEAIEIDTVMTRIIMIGGPGSGKVNLFRVLK